MMLSEICAEIKNYFTHDCDRHIGDFEIIDGVISPSFDIITDYIRIVGSHLNDGVHKVSEMTLQDEKFHGAIWVMSPPADFLAIAKEIEDWQAKYGGVDSQAMSPYSSESFGGYSYSKMQGYASTGGGMLTDWKNLYMSRLSKYRRIREL